jgi:minor extracellular serine protease Vpr
MNHKNTRQRLALAAASALALAAVAQGGTALAAGNESTALTNVRTDGSAGSGADATSAIVKLSGDPLTTAGTTAPKNGKKLDFASTAVKSERARLSAQRNEFKKWLKSNAPKAKVTGEYDIALNAVAVRLNGTPISLLASGPAVISATAQATYVQTAADPDLALISAETAWSANGSGGAPNAGRGVKVGIVDSGIDDTHPCFDDTGYPAVTQLGDRRYTNNKVIVAKVFSNKAANLGFTAEAVQDHGTHVSGTVACNYRTPASVSGANIPYDPSGVAPAALLGNYNVFPGDIENARSEDILNALQAAAEDGMDVINMSLGGDAHGVQDLLTEAVDNLDRANIVVAISAGNEGPGHFTIGSPGSAERALTAGASTVGHFVGLPISSGGAVVATGAVGDFPVPSSNLTAVLTKSAGTPLGTGCTDGSYTDAGGKIALVARGTCTFGTKVALAEKAGAIATIVVNNVGGDPIAMAADETVPSTIPAVQVGLGARDALLATVGQSVTIGSTTTYVDSGNDNIMAGFSSQGPVDVSYRVKPDVVAPGVNVLSSIPQHSCVPLPAEGCWAFFQGTSMASPHLAGMAAVVRGQHAAWTAANVRSAITNSARENVLTKFDAVTTSATDPLVTGSGLADLFAAVNAKVAVSPVSTSFGSVPIRNGSAQTRSVVITNLGTAAMSVPVSVTGSAAFSATPSTLNLNPGASASVTVKFVPGQAVSGDNSAVLRLGSSAHSVLYAFTK